MKICIDCNLEKPLEDFGQLTKSKDGLNPRCKPCKRKIERDYFHNNESQKIKRADYRRNRKYGLTPEQYDFMLNAQNYCCAICSIKLDRSDYTLIPRVDHNHTTGGVRGLLCQNCNCGIGHFYENRDFLAKAIEYLKSFD